MKKRRADDLIDKINNIVDVEQNEIKSMIKKSNLKNLKFCLHQRLATSKILNQNEFDAMFYVTALKAAEIES